MFVNYFRKTTRSSPVNLAAGRLVLGFWLVWKTVWYDWPRLVGTPYRQYSGKEWAIPASEPWLLTVEKWALVLLVCLFVLGYRIRITAAVSSFLLAHLGVVRTTLVGSGEGSNLYVGAMLLLFFALYAETDELSVDGLRRAGRSRSVADRLESNPDRRFAMPALKYSLLYLAALYFSSGLSKIIKGGGLGFAAPDNLSRLVLVRSYKYPWYEFNSILVEYPLLSTLGGIGTLVLELGVLVAVLLGVGFTLLMSGLVVFAFSNLVFLGIFFSDNLFFLGLFFAHDRVYAHAVSDRRIDVVFDSRSTLCTRLLYLLMLLDVTDSVTFVRQRDAASRYRAADAAEFDGPVCVRHGATVFEGYEAFRELFRQFRVFFPAVWLMRFSPVKRLGSALYRYLDGDDDGRTATR